MTPGAIHQTQTAVQRVLLITLALNLLVALSKIVIGLLSGVLAITADGFHSVGDALGNVMGLVAYQFATKPPDEDHPYGHRRFETIAALGIGILLLFTAWEVLSSVLERLMGQPALLQITPVTVVVLLGTFIINIAVSVYQRRKGQALQSQILLADAENTAADIWVTLTVGISLVAMALGYPWMDLVAASIVAVLIARAGLKVLRRSSSILVDTAPYPPAEIQQWVGNVPGVTKIVRARCRGHQSAVHIDVDALVPPRTTAVQSAAIAAAMRAAIMEHVEQSGAVVQEVEVHFLPDTSTL